MYAIIVDDWYVERDRSIVTTVRGECNKYKAHIGEEDLFLIISREKPYFCIRMKRRS